LRLCHQRISVQRNYFEGSTKLFSDPYIAKFSDTSTVFSHEKNSFAKRSLKKKILIKYRSKKDFAVI